MLTFNAVCYHYQQDTFLFELDIQQGSRVAVMGPSGAGKSTLLALAAGFIQPKSGEIVANGEDIVKLEPYQRPFAFLFQEHNLFAHLSVRENIGLGLHPGLKLSQEQRFMVEQAAKQVGIDEYLDRLPEQLSGGQRQRVALARCFVQPHPIWLLDEPFSALDPMLREEMLALVNKLATERNITLVIVTHHLSDARAIGSHFAYVDKGKVWASGNIQDLTPDHKDPILSEFVKAGQG
ncbi:thiamine ABC transporter ATP-binding protein [Vibrio tetraodonis]|uniref:thiamine ABC transporter ATP-binding protein n=1 Tax=Vibrio tetraodonis TaxID=2231647 RepID=UPI000E0B8C19|nr:thiamine ABC transporter ATP-binding protein [Vibrio tetraodonis]